MSDAIEAALTAYRETATYPFVPGNHYEAMTAAITAYEAAKGEDVDPERYVLGLLAEEVGEVLQWVGKSLRFGFDTPGRKDPKTGVVTGETPRDLLPPELGDVSAAIEFAILHGFVDGGAVEEAKERKLAKLLDASSRDNLGRPLAPQPDRSALTSPASGERDAVIEVANLLDNYDSLAHDLIGALVNAREWARMSRNLVAAKNQEEVLEPLIWRWDALKKPKHVAVAALRMEGE